MKYFKMFITFTSSFAKLLTLLVKVINCNQLFTFTGRFTSIPKMLGKNEKNKLFKIFNSNDLSILEINALIWVDQLAEGDDVEIPNWSRQNEYVHQLRPNPRKRFHLKKV